MRPRLRSLRIAGRDYKFRYRSVRAMPDAYGYHWPSRSLIDIRTHQGATEEADTVLHEVIHGILYCQGRPDGGEVEESYVRAIATGLIGVLKDNPEFAAYLAAIPSFKT